MTSSTHGPSGSDAAELEKRTEHVELPDSANEASDEPFAWNFDVIFSLVALNAVYFAASWGLVVPTSAIGFIARAFPESARDSAWIAAAVSLPNCVLQAFIGDLSDILDRRWFLLVGALFGICGNLISGRGTSLGMVIGGQVLNGVGLTLDFLAIPLSAELVPKKNRPVISSISIIVSGVATVIGPLIEGEFIKHEIGGTGNGWRSTFYFGAGFYALAFGLVFWFYLPQDRPNPEGLSKLRRVLGIDWFGVLLVTAGLTMLLVALHYGGNPDPWDSAKVLAPLILGIVCIFTFAVWEWKGTSDGLLRHDLFEHRNYATTLLAIFTAGMVFFGGQSYIPQEVLYLFTSDPVMTSVWSYPYNIATIVGAAASGLMVCSFAALTLGSGLMAIVHPGINFAGWFFPTAIMGIVVVGLCTPDRFIGLSVSMAGAFRGLGGSIGITIFNSIFSSKIDNYLPEKISNILPKVLEAVATGSAEAILRIPGITMEIAAEIQDAVQTAYADSFRYIWYTLIPFAAVSVIISLFLKSTKEQMTGVVAAAVRGRH
ncbi:major facilitator superfamily domain-containing protein [Aspergillus cavernicola]|uniref:Major facilitator superfamily domain-containing protein n=1 Tax=Aspergillus cavernicola TaxID=176166 RepID=A0ABR4I773_9EURO